MIEMCSGYEPTFLIGARRPTAREIGRAEMHVLIRDLLRTKKFDVESIFTGGVFERLAQEPWFVREVLDMAEASAAASGTLVANLLVFCFAGSADVTYQVPGTGTLTYRAPEGCEQPLAELVMPAQELAPFQVGTAKEYGHDYWLFRNGLFKASAATSPSEVAGFLAMA